MPLLAQVGLSLGDVPALASSLGRRAALVPDLGDLSYVVRSVRSKPGRGLAISMIVRRSGASREDGELLTLSIGERALAAGRPRFSIGEVERTPVYITSPGTAEAPELALRLEVFPADSRLPALAACLDPRPGDLLFSRLQDAGRAHLGENAWDLASVTWQTLRYKTGSRCVIAYRLLGADRAIVTVIGKTYAARDHAAVIQQAVTMLRDSLGPPNPVPKPLGWVEDLGLTLTAAVLADDQGPALASTWRPRLGCSPHLLSEGDRSTLRLAGTVLAQLHGASAPSRLLPERDGHAEARSVEKRAGRLTAWRPQQHSDLPRLSRFVAAGLDTTVVDRQVVAHGGYKRAQLIRTAVRLLVTDFDGICRADPALDVGCFLAYLRPASLFAVRPGGRVWFETAGGLFSAAYRDAALGLGQGGDAIAGTLERARLYEASHLLKIANRRVNRLNSCRAQELTAVCGEISACLSEPRNRS